MMVKHACYAEVFTGMGSVFLRRPIRTKAEAINDYNADVSNLFRVIQRHYGALIDCIKYHINSRRDWDDAMKKDRSIMTDIERAAHYIFTVKASVNGIGATFSTNVTRSASFNAGKLEESIEALAVRLQGVIVEQLPYAEFMKKYDSESTLFYCDPPYHGVENYYNQQSDKLGLPKTLFEPADYDKLADIFSELKGLFIMSINDTKEIRKIFKGFKIRKVPHNYTANVKNPIKTHELLISNIRSFK